MKTNINELFNETTNLKTIANEINKEMVSLDIETTGLDPYLDKPIMLQLYDGREVYIIDLRCEFKEDIVSLLKSFEDALIIGTNLKFDLKFLKHHYDVEYESLFDISLAERILYRLKKKGFSLQYMAEKYLKEFMDKEERNSFIGMESQPFTLEQIEYGKYDVLYPWQIREIQLEKLKKKKLLNYYPLEMLYINVLVDKELNGMNFNKDKWLQVYKENLPLFEKQRDKLDDYIKEHHSNNLKFFNRQLDLFSPDPKVGIKWTSSKQVVGFLKELNACPKAKSKSTGKVDYTANAKEVKSSLNTINKDKPQHFKDFIKDYIKFKELEQSVTIFGKDFLKYVHPVTGRIHTEYNQLMTTGRLSSRNPNQQNIPSDNRYRACFDAPSSWKIVNADYSSQEGVIMAEKSGEANLQKLILEGGCSHCFVTKRINKELMGLSDDEIKKNHADERQKAKAANFAIQFGGTGYTIANNLGIPEAQGEEIYNAYFEAFPTLGSYFKKVTQESMRRGYILIDKVAKAKVYLYPDMKEHEVYKKSLNYPVQGEAALMTKYAGILVRRELKKRGLRDRIKFCLSIHDEIGLEVVDEDGIPEIARELLQRNMEKSGRVWIKKLPIKADAVIVDYWKH